LFENKIVAMKFVASIVAASCLSLTSGFSIQPTNTAFGRTSVVLEASRAALKKASRTKWLEKRGLGDGVAAVAASGAGLMTNDGGLEFIKLVHPDSGASSEIYLLGGVVTSFKDGEGVEYIAVRPDAKMDGSKPISGGLSHCWPQVRPHTVVFHVFYAMFD
jgi:glucose-6-phosphate 1-epimerase